MGNSPPTPPSMSHAATASRASWSTLTRGSAKQIRRACDQLRLDQAADRKRHRRHRRGDHERRGNRRPDRGRHARGGPRLDHRPLPHRPRRAQGRAAPGHQQHCRRSSRRCATPNRSRARARASAASTSPASSAGSVLPMSSGPKIKAYDGYAAQACANGETDIAIQQISELAPVPGLDIVGPLPDEVQKITIFSAGTWRAVCPIGRWPLRSSPSSNQSKPNRRCAPTASNPHDRSICSSVPMRAPDPHRPPSAGQLWLRVALLWLAGNGLRITILGGAADHSTAGRRPAHVGDRGRHSGRIARSSVRCRRHSRARC